MSLNEKAQSILAELRKGERERMAAAEVLATAISQRLEAERTLARAKDVEEQAIKAALKKGWTRTELDRVRGTATHRRTKRQAPVADTTPSNEDTEQ